MTVATQHVPLYGWIGLGLLVLGALVVLYWVFRLIGFVVRAPFRALGRAGRRSRTPASGLGSEYEQMVLEAPPSRASQQGNAERSVTGRTGARSSAEAAALTFVVVLAGLSLISAAALIANAAAGGTAAAIAALAAEVAILSFVTLRAYPPGANRHLVVYFVATLLFTVLVPLVYLAWLWMTGKKWTTDCRRSLQQEECRPGGGPNAMAR